MRDALAAEHPDDPAYGTELSRSLSNLGELQRNAGRTAEALASVRRALDLLQDLVRRWPDDVQLRHQLSLSTRGLGILLKTVGQPEESERCYREALAIIERLVAENPAVVEYRRVLATSYEHLGQFLIDKESLAEGLDCLGRARDQAEVVRRSFPDDVQNLVSLASVHRGIGKVLGKQGKPAEGLASFGRAVAICERVSGQGSLPIYDLACTLAICSELAAALPAGTENGGPGAARHYAERSVAELRRAIAAGWKDVELDGARPGTSRAARPRRFPRGDPVPPPGDRARVKVDRGPLAAPSG